MAACPGMVLAGWRFGAAGAAAVLLAWIMLGAAVPGLTRLPYAKRRRIKPHRLFLGYGAALALLSGFIRAGKSLFPAGAGSYALLMAGAACFSLILCQQMIRLSPPRALSWGVGGVLCAAALAVGL